MGLGATLFERVRFEGSTITNASLTAYRVPRFGDVPAIEVVLVDRQRALGRRGRNADRRRRARGRGRAARGDRRAPAGAAASVVPPMRLGRALRMLDP